MTESSDDGTVKGGELPRSEFANECEDMNSSSVPFDETKDLMNSENGAIPKSKNQQVKRTLKRKNKREEKGLSDQSLLANKKKFDEKTTTDVKTTLEKHNCKSNELEQIEESGNSVLQKQLENCKTVVLNPKMRPRKYREPDPGSLTETNKSLQKRCVSLKEEIVYLLWKCDRMFDQIQNLYLKQKETEMELEMTKQAFQQQSEELRRNKKMTTMYAEMLNVYEDDFSGEEKQNEMSSFRNKIKSDHEKIESLQAELAAYQENYRQVNQTNDILRRRVSELEVQIEIGKVTIQQLKLMIFGPGRIPSRL